MTEENALVPFNGADYEILNPETITSLGDVVAQNLEAGDMTPRKFFPQIKTPTLGNIHWSIPTTDGDIDSKTFSGIIMHIQTERGLFPKPYKPNSIPFCVSENGIVGVGEPGGECSSCPNRSFGPDGEPPECAEKKAVYILMKEEVIPMVLRVPPSSFQSLEKHLLKMSRKLKPHYAFETVFSLKSVKKPAATVSEIVFEIGAPIDSDSIKKVQGVKSSIVPFIAPHVEERRHDELAAA